ncbi:MAG TPA: amidohydrolase family protein [Vicinamibacterales bacterium]|nr:amidohydrolase family protein [Vicinamibacterales bacterium]
MSPRMLAAWLAPALLLAPPAGQEPVVAIEGAAVVTMTSDGEPLVDHTVLIRGDTIAAVGPRTSISVPAGARQIDGRGLYVIPGLIDSHVHIYEPRDLSVLLAHGITSVLNQAGSPFHLDLRADVRAGRRVGPTIYTTGAQLKDSAHPAIDTERTVASVTDARRVVATQAAGGYDFIKPWSGFSREIYEAIVDEAHARGARLIGHLPRSAGLQGVGAAGQSIAHIEEFYTKHFDRTINDAGIDAAVAIVAREGIAVSTTLLTYEMIARTVSPGLDGLLDRPGRRLVDPARRLMWEPDFNEYRRATFMERGPETYRRALPFQQRIARALDEAGVPLLAGTDAGLLPGIVPGEDLVRELELLVEAGLPPVRALATATRQPGTFLEPAAPFGTVAIGRRADLVLLGANPLEGVGNLRTIRGVVSRGRYFDRAALDALLADVFAANDRTDTFVRTVMTDGVAAGRVYVSNWRRAGRDGIPFEPMPACLLAYVLANRNDLPGAIELLRLTVEVHSKDYFSAMMLAGALYATGDKAGARDAYAMVLLRRPGHPEAERMWRQLR